ncbi:hypothetical protein [Sinobacterium norvegicum]|uniref:hypothetical protein n=1 Tax=Sinobacterium norvegicum TaxID=1641715 RepID=UPI001F2A597D|nr:hypothetical protein [Sinobacterium norvegicum]
MKNQICSGQGNRVRVLRPIPSLRTPRVLPCRLGTSIHAGDVSVTVLAAAGVVQPVSKRKDLTLMLCDGIGRGWGGAAC